ncbi:MAG: type II secretion system protein M [Pseudomonadota bacterium]
MRIVRIIELPAIDAALLRLNDWWSGLTARERIMVGSLGALLATLVLVFGIVRPLQASRAESLADIRTYETLSARVRAAGSLGPPAGPPPRTGAPADIVTQSAQGFGLTPQVEAMPGGIRVTIPEASYDSVLNWMADVARTSGLVATKVDLQKRGPPGRVFAQVEYRG